MSNLACAEATCLWLTENFTDCQATLQKIESENKPDLKLANNLLVVEHVVAGSGELDRIEAQYDALLANERLAVDDGAAAADMGGASARPRSAGALESPPLVPVRDDLAVAQLNRALLLYRQHRIGPATELLEGLVGAAEALAEGTAVRSLCLLLELLIEGRRLPRAVAVLHAFERLLPQLAEPYAEAATAAAEAGGVGAGAEQPSAPSSSAAAAAGAGQGQGGGCGRSRALALPRVSRWGSGPVARSRALLEQQCRPPPAPDLKLLIRLYRSRLHALAHNTRAAKRELKALSGALQGQPAAPPPVQAAAPAAAPAAVGESGRPASVSVSGGSSGGGAGSLLTCVGAQLELQRGRPRKATKLLLGMMQDPSLSPAHRPLLLNNLALVAHTQGKHTTALLYLSQAASAATATAATVPTAPAGTAGDVGGDAGAGAGRAAQAGASGAAAAAAPLPAVLYNAGLQQLMLQRYGAARECFAKAAAHYENTPLLWLRTAEAALGLYRLRQQQQQEEQQAGSPAPAQGQAAEAAGAGAGDAGASPSPSPGPAEADACPGSLLGEAVAALQTALQQLEQQSEAHQQWQSSSDKLEEGVALAAAGLLHALGPGSADGDAAASGPARTPLGSAAPAAPAAPDSVSLPPPQSSPTLQAAAPAQPQAQTQAAQQQQQQQAAGESQRPVGLSNGGEEARPLAGAGASQPLPVNGVREAHGTDARAALSEELSAVRRAVLANLAFAQLQAQDWAAALQAAQALAAAAAVDAGSAAAPPEAAPSASASAVAAATEAASEYSFLATCYAAEALCQLDRPADAVECLSLWLMAAQEREAAQAPTREAAPAATGPTPTPSTPTPTTTTTATATATTPPREEYYPLGNAAALAALTGPASLAATLTNLASVFAAQGELAQAAGLVRRALALAPDSRPAGLLLVYVELAAGKVGAALALLKQQGQQR